MPNLFVSFMRSLVPLVAALVLGTAARWGLDLDDAAVTSYVSLGLAAAYYALWRGLEWLAERMAWTPLQTLAGVLLGWARPPVYEKPVTMPVRLKLDKVAMRQDVDEFVRLLGTRIDWDRR